MKLSTIVLGFTTLVVAAPAREAALALGLRAVPIIIDPPIPGGWMPVKMAAGSSMPPPVSSLPPAVSSIPPAVSGMPQPVSSVPAPPAQVTSIPATCGGCGGLPNPKFTTVSPAPPPAQTSKCNGCGGLPNPQFTTISTIPVYATVTYPAPPPVYSGVSSLPPPPASVSGYSGYPGPKAAPPKATSAPSPPTPWSNVPQLGSHFVVKRNGIKHSVLACAADTVMEQCFSRNFDGTVSPVGACSGTMFGTFMCV